MSRWDMDRMLHTFMVSFSAAVVLCLVILMADVVESFAALHLVVLPMTGTLVVFGVVFCARAVVDQRLARATEGWTPVPAQVVAATESSYKVPHVWFFYSAGGGEHVGTKLRAQISPDRGFGPALGGYWEGKETTAYHDPKDAARAVLQRGVDRRSFLSLFLMGVGMVLVASPSNCSSPS